MRDRSEMINSVKRVLLTSGLTTDESEKLQRRMLFDPIFSYEVKKLAAVQADEMYLQMKRIVEAEDQSWGMATDARRVSD